MGQGLFGSSIDQGLDFSITREENQEGLQTCRSQGKTKMRLRWRKENPQTFHKPFKLHGDGATCSRGCVLCLRIFVEIWVCPVKTSNAGVPTPK